MVGDRGKVVAARTKDGVDLILGGQEMLRLMWQFELPHDLLSFPGQTVRIFNSVVQAFKGSMISIRRIGLNQLDIASQLVRHYDVRQAELPDQPGEKRFAALVLQRV